VTQPVATSALGRVAILGAGVMGEMVLGGLLRTGIDPADVVVSVRRPERAAELIVTHAVAVADAATAASGADVIVLGAKPQDMSALLAQIADAVQPGAVVISLAAGLPTTYFEEQLPEARVVRTMPNTPGTVGAGMTAVAAGASADAAAIAVVHQVMGTVGRVLDVPESQIDLVTAVSGSGPAYVFLLAESMSQAAVELGLDHELAAELVRQTVVGAAALLNASDVAPEQLRARVTSKNGTTHAAVTVLEERGIRPAMTEAMAAAVTRAKELSAGA
jgi:pyrroline-5-carboxylate reductase